MARRCRWAICSIDSDPGAEAFSLPPLALGPGKRLFVDGGPGAKFTLAGTEAYDSGVVHLTYRPTG